MTWAPRGFRGRNQVRNSHGSLLEAGTRVRVHDGVPGWGEALDRYGVIEKVNLGAFKAYVRTQTKAGFVRSERTLQRELDALPYPKVRYE